MASIEVRGLVIPAQWSADGRVIAVAIHGFDETETLVAPDQAGAELLGLLHKRVIAKGVMITTEGGDEMLRLEEYRVQAGRGLKAGLVVLACGAWLAASLPAMAQETKAAAPAQAEQTMAQPAAKAAPAKAAKPAKAKKAKKTKKAMKPSPQVKQVQEALAAAGYKLQADGLMGKKTKAALKSFQKKNGIKVTGKADAATLQKLGIAG